MIHDPGFTKNMADENNIIAELEEEVQKRPKKVKKQKNKKGKKQKEEKPAEIKKIRKKDDNHIFSIVIAAIIILGIIGIVFGYTKDKLTELRTGGTEVTKGLETQVSTLKQQLQEMKEKADSLEKRSESNKSVVLDLFEKNRKFPSRLKTADWSNLTDPEYSFTVTYPQTWEFVKPAIETKEEAGLKQELLYFQPIGQEPFANAITIKTDYSDFASLPVNEKYDIFKELDFLDKKDFTHGKLLYFINLDPDNQEIPTILILTDNNIFRATFNITDKSLDSYFEYRKNFEEILSTFELAPGLEEETDDETNDE